MLLLSLRALRAVTVGAILGWAAGLVPVWAQAPSDGEPRRGQAFGLAVLKTPQAYVGADDELIVVPIFQLRRGGFFIDGIRLGYGWTQAAGWSVQLSVMPQFAELDPDSSPGLDGMEKRRASVDGALSLGWESKRVTASAAVFADLLGRSDGRRLEAEIGLPLTAARWRVVPSARAVWVDRRFADYYAGVRPTEVRPGRPLFRGSSTLNPGVALTVVRPFGTKWVLLGRAEVLSLGSGVGDSPVIAGDTMSFGLVGLARTWGHNT